MLNTSEAQREEIKIRKNGRKERRKGGREGRKKGVKKERKYP